MNLQHSLSHKPPIGILGGSFDPVHFGHLRMALELKQIIQLQQVHLIPCQKPVHKETVYANSEHRLAMLSLACADEPSFIVDDREINRDGPSYMIDTLKSLQLDFPHNPLCLLLGSDAFLQLPTWKSWQEILHCANIVVALRPGYEWQPDPEVQNLLKNHEVSDWQALHDQLTGAIYLQDVSALDISATTIRSQRQGGYSPRFLLPDSVLNYIEQNSLY